ncbi:MAG: hypothetical protein IKP24_03985 [Alphaproteobacteria bacterium]|nr:hypothetical protein [Alphaproteobacteria bacterium]
MAKKVKEVEVIDMHGAKTVAKKPSVIKGAKRVFAIVTVIWLSFVAVFPLYVKNHYAGPIKKSMVVSMFFDLQRNIQEQYAKLLSGIKDAINIEKPVMMAVDKVKIAQKQVGKVTDTTAKAKETTTKAAETTSGVKKLTGLANMFGVKTDSVDKALDKANAGIDQANKGIAKVDDTAKMVNEKLDKVQTDLIKLTQIEIDKVIDAAIKKELDKNSGGLGTTLLTNYGIKHVYPWRPSSWPVAVKIYNDLEKSNLGVVQILTRTVNKYFGYVAWGLVIAAWAAGLFIWSMIYKKYKMVIAPFLVCPRCGHTYADKRTAMSLLKALQPWKWF